MCLQWVQQFDKCCVTPASTSTAIHFTIAHQTCLLVSNLGAVNFFLWHKSCLHLSFASKSEPVPNLDFQGTILLRNTSHKSGTAIRCLSERDIFLFQQGREENECAIANQVSPREEHFKQFHRMDTCTCTSGHLAKGRAERVA